MKDDFLPIKKITHLEMYVSNSLQAAYYYCYVFGFAPLAYSGLKTGNKEKESYVIRQGDVVFCLSSPLHSGGEVSDQIYKSGDGVKSIAFEVEDSDRAIQETKKRGAEISFETKILEDEKGNVKVSAIELYGSTIHEFIEKENYHGVFMPGFIEWSINIPHQDKKLQYIDHVVANVELGKMNYWVDFYKNVMGFFQLLSFDDKDISTDYTALMSKVMSSGTGVIKLPINEPAEGKKKSQIEEYLEFYEQAGVQHIALSSSDIIYTVTQLRATGVEFLEIPETYYKQLPERVGEIDEEIALLADLGILVDRDDEGYLLQIFTRPLGPRPTLFFEIIQRKGSQSFGKGNFKALFEAIEAEQELRGTL